ncbi:MAG: hypothetical protein JRC86_04760 [Deltaproteobacteria bacterium]|nr:hypothetical protein [Deltaproteobacteria bacterium]
MNEHQQKLIAAVNNNESVRIIRGDVDGMKILEWIEKNLLVLKWISGAKATDSDFSGSTLDIVGFGGERRLAYEADFLIKHTFQASDIIQPDYERIGDKFKARGKWWQEVKTGQMIEGTHTTVLKWDGSRPGSGSLMISENVEIRTILPQTEGVYNWMFGSVWHHMALPIEAPKPKTVQVSKERMFEILKKELGADKVEIVEGES